MFNMRDKFAFEYVLRNFDKIKFRRLEHPLWMASDGRVWTFDGTSGGYREPKPARTRLDDVYSANIVTNSDDNAAQYVLFPDANITMTWLLLQDGTVLRRWYDERHGMIEYKMSKKVAKTLAELTAEHFIMFKLGMNSG